MQCKIKCELCNSADFASYIATESVKYSRCLNCGLIFQNPIISEEEINNIYTENYFEYEIENQKNFFNLMLLGLKDIDFENIKETFPNKRMLDIGCATGMLLNHLKNEGFDTYGVEICKESAEYAKKNYSLNIYQKHLKECNFKENYFGVIHFSHLIEHVPNPNEFLKEVYKILSPNGYIILTTPNADGLFAKKYKENWRAVMPQHLWLFRKNTLINFLKDIGFKILKNVSWGSIPIEKKTNKTLKYLADRFVKKTNTGDVMLILAKKEYKEYYK